MLDCHTSSLVLVSSRRSQSRQSKDVVDSKAGSSRLRVSILKQTGCGIFSVGCSSILYAEYFNYPSQQDLHSAAPHSHHLIPMKMSLLPDPSALSVSESTVELSEPASSVSNSRKGRRAAVSTWEHARPPRDNQRQIRLQVMSGFKTCTGRLVHNRKSWRMRFSRKS